MLTRYANDDLPGLSDWMDGLLTRETRDATAKPAAGSGRLSFDWATSMTTGSEVGAVAEVSTG